MTTFATTQVRWPDMGGAREWMTDPPNHPQRDLVYAQHSAAAWSVICWLTQQPKYRRHRIEDA